MATITAIKMKINGVTVKPPKIGGITYKSEKVWSSNTGRTASGRMVGTIKTIKKTVSIVWPPLTEEERRTIEGQISNTTMPFSVLELTLANGGTMTMECYFGTPSFQGYKRIGRVWKYESGQVDGIER